MNSKILSHRPRHARPVAALVGLGVLFGMTCRWGLAADAEEYLQQLEADAKRRAATLQATRPAAAANTLEVTSERLPLGLSPADFESILNRQFVGTYVFYQRLGPAEKLKIYELYTQDNRVSAIREETLRRLAGGR